MEKVKEFLKEHSALVAGAGFLCMAVYAYSQNDLQTAAHDVMLALASFGIKFGVEKIWNGLPDSPAPPAAK